MAFMITTEDNPYDPRTDFLAWYAWDVENDYNTSAYLARVAHVPDDVPQVLIDHYITLGMQEIVKEHANGLYKLLPVDEAA